MAGEGLDSGYNGRLVSLAGILGKEGYGLRTKWAVITLDLGANTETYPNNPSRMWLFVENRSAGTIYVIFGTPVATPTPCPSVTLKSGEALQIDKNLPWSGSLAFYSEVAAAAVHMTEAELAGT